MGTKLDGTPSEEPFDSRDGQASEGLKGLLSRPIKRLKLTVLACLWLRHASSLGGLTATR